VFGFEAFHNRYETLGIFVHRNAMERKVTVLAPSVAAVK
jgi:hypothetical protein